MEKICVNFENCYGIKKLEHDFDFTESNGFVIYASNGTMKTSFAKTFIDIHNEDEPKDRIYEREPVIFDVDKISSGVRTTIDKNEIFVIESFKDDFNFDKISRLIVRKDLKDKYDKLFNEINTSKTKLIRRMANLLGLPQKNVEETFMIDFNHLKGNFFDFLVSLESEIDGDIKIPVNDIKYKVIFDKNLLNFIKDPEIFESIEEYAEKYSDIIAKSPIFEENLFTHNDAANVGKNLDKSNFFKAEHKISLKNGEIINNKKELDELIKKQKELVLSDETLKNIFEKIDSALERNGDFRQFKSILNNYPTIIIPELENIEDFKKKVWIAILNSEIELYNELIGIYVSGKSEIENIIEEAKSEESAWKDVVDLFNERFFVPFKIKVVNQADVILKNEVPTLEFIYTDETEHKKMDKDEILGILSNGEKRALYLLNIIYEIEARKLDGNPVLIIADDIADSFDYQNKYAIVEYLSDILKEDFFKLIILTHNFDFYRTVGSRLDIHRKNGLMVLKNHEEIKIVDGQYLNSAFGFWKRQLEEKNANNCKRIIIASIPFVRNLIEYIKGKQEPDYLLLTNLLHLKENSGNIQLSELQRIYSNVWNTNFILDDDTTVFDFIFDEAEIIKDEETSGINLENKIALSIAIRLIAEDYMIYKITDKTAIAEIGSNQTRKLFNLFKEEYRDRSAVPILEKVNLMTPENIHLNSFMYEPILDMDDKNLRDLYQDVKVINDARDST
ncbi:hypothetical protein [Methanobacterium formicicum]|uniref:Protein CR006 P-loop domain-containing protein n=1 Tax=Methanobacterium formicicum TaxID=2162 RepID=A0A843AZ78_METFO|nr:hypothetical protein [Methanobacterium formicicum]MBF4475935.1 hypothetical protein [Methanobacterium formicicum]